MLRRFNLWLRIGKHVGHGKVADLSHTDMARLMMGKPPEITEQQRALTQKHELLRLNDVRAIDRSELKDIHIENLSDCTGEIVGVAGISGNGQSELMEILTGQRQLVGGSILVSDEPYHATGAQAHRRAGTRFATCRKSLYEMPAHPI